jgi:cytoskeletal protein CcmA (bactofilin family)
MSETKEAAAAPDAGVSLVHRIFSRARTDESNDSSRRPSAMSFNLGVPVLTEQPTVAARPTVTAPPPVLEMERAPPLEIPPVVLKPVPPAPATPTVSTARARGADAPLAANRCVELSGGTTKGGRTVVPAGWMMKGVIEADDDVQVFGCVIGNIALSSPASTFSLEPAGQVKGNVAGGNVALKGHFAGEVDAKGATVEIAETAVLEGRVTYTNIRIAGGRHRVELVYQDADTGADPRPASA